MTGKPKRYRHNFVSFMLFLAAVKQNRLQKCIEAPAEKVKEVSPTHIITKVGKLFTRTPQGWRLEN